MNLQTINVKLDEGAKYPTRAHATDAGLDLACMRNEVVRAYETKSLDTGVHIAIPDGYVGLVIERSSLHRSGLVLANSVGVIDAGYTGSIKIPIHNTSSVKTNVEKHTRLAQLVIVPCLINTDLVEVDELEETERSNGGFGSTGVM